MQNVTTQNTTANDLVFTGNVKRCHITLSQFFLNMAMACLRIGYKAYKNCLIITVASFIMRRSFTADCKQCGWPLNFKVAYGVQLRAE